MPDTPESAALTPHPGRRPSGEASEILSLAMSHANARRHDTALGLLVRIVGLEPMRRGTWFLIWHCRQALGQLVGAADAYRFELALDAGNVNALNNRGVCCYEIARLALLRQKLRPAMAASPVCDTKRFARDFHALRAAIR